MIRQFQSASLAALLLVAATSVRGETIRTIDDKTTTGTIKGFEQGALVIDPKSGGASVKIPLAEVVEIVWRPVAAKPQPKVAPIARHARSAWSQTQHPRPNRRLTILIRVIIRRIPATRNRRSPPAIPQCPCCRRSRSARPRSSPPSLHPRLLRNRNPLVNRVALRRP